MRARILFLTFALVMLCGCATSLERDYKNWPLKPYPVTK